MKYQGRGDHHEPAASLTRTDNFDEICTLFTSVISAGFFGFLSRILVRYATLPFPDKGYGFRDGLGSRRMQMECWGMVV